MAASGACLTRDACPSTAGRRYPVSDAIEQTGPHTRAGGTQAALPVSLGRTSVLPALGPKADGQTSVRRSRVKAGTERIHLSGPDQDPRASSSACHLPSPDLWP